MQDTWSFVAMEYHALVLNRTYVVSVNDREINGKVCRGLTAVEAGTGIVRLLTHPLSVQGDLNAPSSYVDEERLSRPAAGDFATCFSDVTAISYNHRKKWGMGYYPHDGRVLISTPTRARELIILGRQSGRSIADRLAESVGRANLSFKSHPA